MQFSTPGHDLFDMSGKSPASPMLSAASGVSSGAAAGEYLVVPDQLSGGCSSSPSCLSVPGEKYLVFTSIDNIYFVITVIFGNPKLLIHIFHSENVLKSFSKRML